jgi:hypothetical protein
VNGTRSRGNGCCVVWQGTFCICCLLPFCWQPPPTTTLGPGKLYDVFNKTQSPPLDWPK